MKLTHTIPTETGWYWYFSASEEWKQGYRTGRVAYSGQPELVRIQMNYSYRNKIVPYIIGMDWRGPLAKMGNGRPGYWSAKLEEPEAPGPEYPEEAMP